PPPGGAPPANALAAVTPGADGTVAGRVPRLRDVGGTVLAVPGGGPAPTAPSGCITAAAPVPLWCGGLRRGD
ncbi:hypothetical protein ACWC2M_40680, partial [Streptomyces sp. NPDC001761]